MSDKPKYTEDAFQQQSLSPNPSSVKHTHKVSSSGAQRIRRRNRIITSCLECRKRKIKCDKLHPCTNCVRFGRDCLFLAPTLDSASRGKLTEIKEHMGTLERALEEDAAKHRDTSSLSPSSRDEISYAGYHDEDEFAGDVLEDRLATNPYTVQEAVYDDDAENEFTDLGIQLGKLRITEKVGGFVRPRLVEELNASIQYNIHTVGVNQETLSMATAKYHAQNLDNFMGPTADYIVPDSGFFFSNGPAESNSLMMFLPSRQVADTVMAQYWTAVHPICTTVHRPTFERSYEKFWSDISVGYEPPNSLQACVFAALFASVVSMPAEAVTRDFGVAKVSLADNFRVGCESALRRSKLLHTTKLETLQAFVMYMITLCRGEVSRAHSTLTAAAIRLAECMGLQRDGTHYGLSPVDTYTRRLIWHQLCFLDIRCCWASAPRPQIRGEDFDTRLPLNVNEVELESAVPSQRDADSWTDTTFTILRFETIAFERYVWFERGRVEKKKASLTALLAKISEFRAKVGARYLHLINREEPLQRHAYHYFWFETLRFYIMALHRYLPITTSLLPDRLENICISAAISVTEHAITLATDPLLERWAWYVPAYQQYQAAVLLLKETASPTALREADRVWACLDYVFDIPAGLTTAEKTALVLGELRDRVQVYQAQRKPRAPTNMRTTTPNTQQHSVSEREKSSIQSPRGSTGSFSREASASTTLMQAGRTASSSPASASRGNYTVAPYLQPNTADSTMPGSFQPYSAMQNPARNSLLGRLNTQGQGAMPGIQSDNAEAVLSQIRQNLKDSQGVPPLGVPGPFMADMSFPDVQNMPDTVGLGATSAGSRTAPSIEDLMLQEQQLQNVYTGATSLHPHITGSTSPMASSRGDGGSSNNGRSPQMMDSNLDLAMDIDWTELDRLFPGPSAETFDFQMPPVGFIA